MTNSWANSFANFGATGVSSIYGTNFATLPNAAPDPRFLAVSQVQTSGYSNYDAGSVQLRHAMNYGFQGQINFTWAHDSGIVGIYNPNNFGFGCAPLSIDVRKAMAADLDPGRSRTSSPTSTPTTPWAAGISAPKCTCTAAVPSR